ncbi:hypothetical protein C1631_022110 [Chryseobacterium phosphatilyticum]|uniref:Uncharacterized protein n=1 Tax=Chryseobacterium phosphatilyticum TaxID=475075 RepID=A0A316WR33_9FLAO|nr:hypothetical protein [Chryseobacterium phosphatilyticum]PWN63667.1 hypothetical protein C1631_022110 [Chryseobacterium phosphatilyticum]
MAFELDHEEKDDLSGFKYAWYKNAEYLINIKSYLTLGSGKANQTEIEQDWNVLPGEYNHITIGSSPQRYIQSDGQMRAFYEILEEINKATSVLQLSLDTDKSILEVTNKEEISDKWNEIKRDLHFFELVKESYEAFIHLYDKEFNNIDQNIKLNLLYQIMFYPLPVFRGGSFIDQMPVRNTLSTLFPGEKISYDSQYRISKKENGGYLVKLEAKNKGDHSHFKSVYQDKYQRTLGSSLAYKYFLEGEYIYNEDSVLSEIMFHVKEELNENMFYVCRYHIRLNKQ